MACRFDGSSRRCGALLSGIAWSTVASAPCNRLPHLRHCQPSRSRIERRMICHLLSYPRCAVVPRCALTFRTMASAQDGQRVAGCGLPQSRQAFIGIAMAAAGFRCRRLPGVRRVIRRCSGRPCLCDRCRCSASFCSRVAALRRSLSSIRPPAASPCSNEKGPDIVWAVSEILSGRALRRCAEHSSYCGNHNLIFWILWRVAKPGALIR